MLLPSLLHAQTDKILLTNYQACGGATLVPSVQYNTNHAPITIYYERLTGADIWQIEATQVYNYRSSYIQYNGNDILQPTFFRVRALDGLTGNIYISNSVSVDPTLWNVDRGTAWSTAYATWGGNCNNSNFINIESNTISSGRPPFSMQYKKQSEVNYTGAGETTGYGLIPNIAWGSNYDIRITDRCGKIVNLTTRLYLSCSAGDLVVPSGCQTADGSISIYHSNDNRYVGIPPYTYNVRKPGTATNDTAFVSSNIFNNLTSGTYDYAIRDACGHTSSAGSVVLGNATPVCYANYSYNLSDSCYTDIAITPTKGTGPFTYGLSFNNGPYTYSQDSTFKVFADGPYFYNVTDNCGTVSRAGQSISIYRLRPFVDSVSRIGTSCIKDFVVHASRSLKPYVYEVTGLNPYFTLSQTSDTFRNLAPNVYKFHVLNRCGKSGDDKWVYDTVACNLRTVLGDFESNNSSIGCANISGNKWIDITDDNGNLIYSINPNNNVLNNVCWGTHLEDNNTNAPRSSNINGVPSYFLDRNFYIEPPANITLTDSVSIRLYVSDYELDNMLGYLSNLGLSYGVEDLKILKKKGTPGSPVDLSVTNDSIANLSQFTVITPFVGQFGPDAKYLEFKVKDFSEFNPYVGEFSVLPLHLISFTALKQNNAVKLNWITTQEINTDRFEIEWGTNGINFTTISSLPAFHQNSNYYTYVHNQPAQGANFYRLKQFDADGRYKFSKIILMNYSNAKIVIAPNPVHDQLSVQLPANNNFKNWKIFDVNGKILLQKKLPASVTTFSINVQTLVRGLYFLELDGEETKRIKFIKI